MTLEPGSTFGDYRIERLLGSGASGLVFAATRLSNDKPIALKVLRSQSSGRALQEENDRFLREVRICIRLSHPNIVPVIDSGRLPDGEPFAAYEFVPGETLYVTLQREGALPFRDAARLTGQVLRALAYSHANGVVHRDVKPANVMISGAADMREARVLDFGVAGRLRGSGSTDEAALTRHGYFVGTPLYACLDQIRGSNPRPAWDLYAWSLLFLECLSGEHPCAASGRMPWDPESHIEIPGWLTRHSFGRLLERLLSGPEEVDGSELLRGLEAAAHELTQPMSSGPTARRRWVCVGACQFSEELDQRAELDIEGRDQEVRRCQESATAIVERLGGRVLSRVGDGLVFGFGYARPHEDDAARAVQASRLIIDTIADLADGRAGISLNAQAGLHAGEAIFEGQTSDGFADVAGATPEGAARLCQLAQPGEVIASGALRELLRSSHDLVPVDAVKLPGVATRMPAYRITPDVRFGVHVSNPRTPFVGRRRELELLRDRAAAARRGHPSMVSIAGEAGIGKSRLLRELHAELSCDWLECRCQPDGQASPYHPVAQLLDGLGTTEELLEANGLATPTNIALIEVMRTGDARDDRLLGISGERQREQLRDLLIRLLTMLAGRRFVIVAIEDLHWADPSTIELIAQLAGETAAWGASQSILSLLVVTTARPGFVPPWSQGTATLCLDRLTDADIEILVRGLNSDLDARTVTDIQLQSEGVPLFAEEIALAGTTAERGTSSWGSPGIPPVLIQYLTPRLETLSTGAKEVLCIASVLGREFDERLLELILDRSAEQFGRYLRELTEQSIIYRRRTALQTISTFKHGLIRDVAYDGIPRAVRRRHHHRVADTLINRLPEMASRRPESVAAHLHAARRIVEAIEWWTAAMPRMLAAGAYDEAETVGRRALHAAEELTDLTERASAELAVRELLGTAVASKVGLGAQEVRDIYAPAIELCERLGGTRPLGVLWGIWSFTVVGGAEVEATGQLINHLLDSAAHTDDPLVIATAHAAAGTRQFVLGDIRGSFEHFAIADRARQAPAFRQSVRYHDVGMYTPAWQMIGLALCGEFEAAREMQHALLEEARSLGSPSGLSIALAFALNCHRIELDYERTIVLADEQIGLCDEQRIIALKGAAQCSRGWARACLGDDGGLAEAQEGLLLCSFIGMRLNQVLHMAGLAEAQLLRGDPEAALATVAQGLMQSAETVERYQDAELLRIEGQCHRELGDIEAAERALRAALERAREFDIYVHELKCRLSLAELLHEQQRPAAAWELVRRLQLPATSTVPVIVQARNRLEALAVS